MHQPLYRQPGERECFAPWVRLHASRSYYDFARIPGRFPALRWTVNLVPSLVRQIEEYCEGGTDTFRELLLKPVSGFAPAEKRFLVRHFFSAHMDRMITPIPRYRELLDRRDESVRLMGEADAWRAFGEQDFRDLKALFHLAWFGFSARADFPRISELVNRGSGFSEDDCLEIDRIQGAILRNLVDLYRDHWRQGNLELSTTPFYHPILPLLIDSRAALEAMPEAALPVDYGRLDDAREQIVRALRFTSDRLGQTPDGMWPAEGSVSQAAAELFAEQGLKWIATDEENLYHSVRESGAPPDICGPWFAGAPGREIRIVFRNRDISDRIGFRYAHQDPVHAVNDLIQGVRAAASGSAADSPVVYIVLDGENPWETYPNAGLDFLAELDRSLVASGDIRMVTVSESLQPEHAIRGRIARLRAGSWVNGRFSIWIGGPQKNAAWDALNYTRRELWDEARNAGNIAALESILAAEGSDWFWWMDGQFATEHRFNFHDLFQGHLEAAWAAMGRQPATEIIERFRVTGDTTELIWTPHTRMKGQIDGLQNSYFEWSSAVRLLWEKIKNAGTMTASRESLDHLYLGFDGEGNLLIRLDGFLSGPERIEAQVSALRRRTFIAVKTANGSYVNNEQSAADLVAVFRKVLEMKVTIRPELLGPDCILAVRLRCYRDEQLAESRWIHMRAPTGAHRLSGWNAV